MIYTVKKAQLISEQLRKFSDSDSWMVVGQYVNIEFWINEVQTSLQAIHNARFRRMYTAQKDWIDSHSVQIPDNCRICGGICELGNGKKKPRLPQKSPETTIEKKEVRKELVDNMYSFLRRSYKLGLLDETDFRKYCDKIGTSVDLDDIDN